MDNSSDDDLCVRAAVARWLTWEADFQDELAKGLTPELFERWLAHWHILARLDRSTQLQLVFFLDKVARPVFLDTTEPCRETFMAVDEINDQAVKTGITTSALMSILSTFACSCSPAVYAPTHRDNRGGLLQAGFRPRSMSYCAFMEAFTQARAEFVQRCSSLIDQFEGCSPQPKLREIIAARATDLRLRLLGGLRRGQLEELILEFARAAAQTRKAAAGRTRDRAMSGNELRSRHLGDGAV